MSTRQTERLDEILSDVVDTVISEESGQGFFGKFSESYPEQWNTILHVTGLMEKAQSEAYLAKQNREAYLKRQADKTKENPTQ